MSQDMPKLTDQEVLRHAQERLEATLPLHAEGTKCPTDDLFKVLLGVAATQGPIESLCADLVGTPDPQTIRGYLNAQLCVEDLPGPGNAPQCGLGGGSAPAGPSPRPGGGHRLS